MSVYFHGTTPANKKSILMSGVHIKEPVNGQHFGAAFYCTTTKEQASSFGSAILSVEISDQLLLEIPSMDHYNQVEFQAMFSGGVAAYLRGQGLAGFILTDITGGHTVVVYDVSVIKLFQ